MKQHRDFFIQRLQTALVGPGSDVFGGDEQAELLSDYPLQVYSSAILFPERCASQTAGELAQSNDQAQFSEGKDAPDGGNAAQELPTGAEGEAANSAETSEQGNRDNGNLISSNNYFPSNFGLSFCLDDSVKNIVVKFCAGHYKWLKTNPEDWRNKRVKIACQDFEVLKNSSLSFAELLEFEPAGDVEGFMFFTADPGKTAQLREELKDFFKKEYPLARTRFDLFLSRRIFQRFSIEKEFPNLLVADDSDDVFKNENGDILARYHLKIIPKNGKKYVKLLLANTARPQPSDRFNLGNEELNQKCLFQVQIQVTSKGLLPYKDHLALNPFDEEASRIAFQHKSVQSFGIGHGCAVDWEQGQKRPASVRTTFLPQISIAGVSNDFRPEDKTRFEPIARLKNLSIWTPFSQAEICQKLREFVSGYESWIDGQERQAASLNGDEVGIAQEIIGVQKSNLARLHRNVDLLETDREVFRCFLLANTAMLVQMFLSIDPRFGGNEKSWKETDALASGEPSIYQSLDFFKNNDPTDKRGKTTSLAYRPFQLAFFLLNLGSLAGRHEADRNEVVDLLWFPTGGGKTEAYLALSAFVLLWRRSRNHLNAGGVSVIMRYTLRLLTAQQFERASRLIVALEFLRRRQGELQHDGIRFSLGEQPFGIGLWVGKATTPNKLKGENSAEEIIGSSANPHPKSLRKAVNNLNNGTWKNPAEAENCNVFQISACPWCGCKLVSDTSKTEGKRNFKHGFGVSDNRFEARCLNDSCAFHDRLPVDVVDESLYANPPSLLFATVDKFAQLSHREEGHVFFNSLHPRRLPPDLIIQDELHLLNGPLGSVVGLFELVVEMLCTRDGSRPKIIASTATTRNTGEQVSNLYGGRRVNIFPPPGLSYDDNYFSFLEKDPAKARRLHLGILPTGKTYMDTQVRAVLPNLLLARIELFRSLQAEDKDVAVAETDPYWTVVSYYNTLKDVGKVNNKVGDEALDELRRLHRKWSIEDEFSFNYRSLASRSKELTSRIPSSTVKQVLKELEAVLRIEEDDDGKRRVRDATDLVLASNMFSVGIDISRLNLMLMNGQPKNVAEYIQASSRVARSREGLVVNLLDANRAREKSHFEHFLPFHQTFYRFVEPLTVTPFTEITFDKVLGSVLVCWVRHLKNLPKNEQAHDFDGNVDALVAEVRRRIPEAAADMRQAAEDGLRQLAREWRSIISSRTNKEKLKYKGDLIRPSDEMNEWSLPQSMREVDTESILELKLFTNQIEQHEPIEAIPEQPG